MKKSILKLGILALLSFNFVSTLPVQALMQNGVWNNDLKTIFAKNEAIILAINIRSFNAQDLNNDDIIDINKGEISGNFINAINRLNEIKAQGINTIHLLPITPVGKIKAMGTAGSLYAISDFGSINPQLDDKTNTLSAEQEAKNFIKECHKRNIRVIVDLPSCGSYDLFLSKPELFEKDENEQPLVPADWTDVRMFKVTNKDGSMNDALYLEYKKFIDLMQKLGVDGIRADVATCKTPEFWTKLISYAKNNDPQFLFLAEASESWTQPITKNAPFTPPYKLLEAGFDGWYGSFFDFKNWNEQEQFEKSLNLVNDIRKDFGMKNQAKSVIGSFATHDEISPIITGGTPFTNLIFWLQATLPVNSYFVDGVQTGDSYQYQYANQKAPISYTDDKTYYVHKGQFDIFNFSRKPGNKNSIVLNEFIAANKFKYAISKIINSGEYEFIKTDNKNIFAYTVTNGEKSILVVLNKNLIYNASTTIKLKDFKENDFIYPFLFNNDPTVIKDTLKVELQPGDITIFILERRPKEQKSRQKYNTTSPNMTPIYR